MKLYKKYLFGSLIVFTVRFLIGIIRYEIFYSFTISKDVQTFTNGLGIPAPDIIQPALMYAFLYCLLFLFSGIIYTIYMLLKKILPSEDNSTYLLVLSAIIVSYFISTTIFSQYLYFSKEGSTDLGEFTILRLNFITRSVFLALTISNFYKSNIKLLLTILFFSLSESFIANGFIFIIRGKTDLLTFVEIFINSFGVLASIGFTLKLLKILPNQKI